MLAAERPRIVMTHDYPPLTGGGLAIGVRELAGLLCAENRVHVITSRLSDHAADDRHRALPQGDETGYAQVTLLRAASVLSRADVIIAHVTFSFRRLAVFSVVLGRLLRKPTVCVIHTAPDHCQYNRLRRLPSWGRRAIFGLAGQALRGCSAVVALGPAHAASVAGAGLRVTHFAPLPVSPNAAYARAFRQHVRRGNAIRVIGFAGELSLLKGADTLPALFRALAPQHEFRIAGSGPLAGHIARCVMALSPAQRAAVVINGEVSPAGMPDFYRGVDCLIVPSRTEAHSRVTLEAMLAGVIVLASPTCGSSDLIVDGETGILVRPGDPASIAEALAVLGADPRLAQSIREQAVRFATSLAADSRSRWCQLLAEIAGGRRRR